MESAFSHAADFFGGRHAKRHKHSNNLTRNETLAGIRPLIPPAVPLFNQERGRWQAGEWNYFMWQKDNLRVLLCSSTDELSRTKYFVKHWHGDQVPTQHEVKEAIRLHASAIQDIILEEGVVTKRGYKDEVHIWCTKGLEVRYKTGEDSFYLTHMTGPNHRGDPLRSHLWIPGPLRGDKIPLIAGGNGDVERRAEIMFMSLFYAYLKNAWTGHKIHESAKGRPLHYIVHVKNAAEEIARRHGGHDGKAKEGFEIAFELGTSVLEHASTVGMIKLAYTVGGGAFHLIKKSPHENEHKHPGCPDVGHLAEKAEMIGDPKYIAPLGDYFLQTRPEFLAQGHYVEGRDFGVPGLISGLDTIDTSRRAGLSRVARFSRGTEVRPYFSETDAPDIPLAKRVGGARGYRPDGLVVTLTQDCALFHYDAERHVYRESRKLPQALEEHREALENGAIFVTNDLLSGQVSQISLDDVNRMFKGKFGVNYRTPPEERLAMALARGHASGGQALRPA